MTAPLVKVEPCDFPSRRFVYSTCWRTVLATVGDKAIRSCAACMAVQANEPPCPRHRLLDSHHTRQLVEELVSNCETRVAFVEGMSDEIGRREIMAFVVEDPRDKSIEFLSLRRQFRDMQGLALSGAIMKALLGESMHIVMRRQPAPVVTAAIVGYGATIVVRPRSVP